MSKYPAGASRHDLPFSRRYALVRRAQCTASRTDDDASGLVPANAIAAATSAHDVAVAPQAVRSTLTQDEKLRRLVKLAPIPIGVIDLSGQLVYLNDRFVAFFGYGREELPDLAAWWRLAYPDPEHRRTVTEAWNAAVGTAAAAGTDIAPAEFAVTCKDGKTRVVEISGIVFDDSVLATFVDVTARKMAEQALHTSRETLRGYFNNSAVGMCVTSLEKGWLEVNDRLCAMLGYTREEFERLTWAEITHPEDLNADLVLFNEVLAGVRDGYELDKRYIRKDGSVIDTTLAVTCERNPDGSVHHFLAQIIDTTARTEVEDALRQSELRYRLLAENMHDTVWTMDLHGRFTYVSPSVQRLRGYTAEEFIGQTLEDMLTPASAAVARTELATVLATLASTGIMAPARIELEQVHRDGSTIWTEIVANAIRDASGAIVGLLGVTRNISERRAQEEEIRRLNATLEQRVQERTTQLEVALADLKRADRAKDEFLAAMSHELRTPLTGVLTTVEALLQQQPGPLNERQLRYTQTIKQSGERLLGMINGILRYVNLASTREEVKTERCHLHELGRISVQAVRRAAAKKRQHLSLAVDPAILIIYSDPVGIVALLENLLGNAVKFTPEGGEIGLEIRRTAGDRHVQMTVWDTGIGIAPEQMTYIFQPFVQGDGGIARQFDGVGLGLAYVARMVELLGGTIAVESTVGVGSRFIVTLPG